MNNDLISREALYNEVDTWGCNDYDKYDFLDAIKNAPAVEPDMEFAKECYANGYEDGKNERPQGEWIKHIDDLFPEESTEECPFCHEEQLIRLGNDDNYCPNCGADMRGGKK